MKDKFYVEIQFSNLSTEKQANANNYPSSGFFINNNEFEDNVLVFVSKPNNDVKLLFSNAAATFASLDLFKITEKDIAATDCVSNDFLVKLLQIIFKNK